MIGDANYPLTEWEWFKTQLRLRSLEFRGPKFVTNYVFREETGDQLGRQFPEAVIECWFWCETSERLLKKKAKRAEHLQFYASWIESEGQRLRETVTLFPSLSKELDLRRHVVYIILHSYGMGSVPVCHFYQGTFHWAMSTEQIPE